MAQAIHLISLPILTDLQAQPGSGDNVVIILGLNTVGDGKGALYYWDPLSTDPMDTVYYNTVVVTNVPTGRWKKVFQRMVTLPHGTLVVNNGKKEFFCSSVIGADSTATINLTTDGTATGTPIFSEVWFDDSKASVNTLIVNDAVTSCRKLLSSNLKQLTHLFYRGNNSGITLLGLSVLNVIGFRSAIAGTPVQFKVEGI